MKSGVNPNNVYEKCDNQSMFKIVYRDQNHLKYSFNNQTFLPKKKKKCYICGFLPLMRLPYSQVKSKLLENHIGAIHTRAYRNRDRESIY